MHTGEYFEPNAPAHGAVCIAAGQRQARYAADVVSDQPLAPACMPQAIAIVLKLHMLCPVVSAPVLCAQNM